MFTKTWLKLILKISNFNFNLRKKIVENHGLFWLLILGVLYILGETLLVILSLPSYLALSKRKGKSKDVLFFRKRLNIFISIALVILVWLVVSLFLGTFTGNKQVLFANTVAWDFDDPSEYTYDVNKVQIIDGMVLVKSQYLDSNEVVIEDEVSEEAIGTDEIEAVEEIEDPELPPLEEEPEVVVEEEPEDEVVPEEEPEVSIEEKEAEVELILEEAESKEVTSLWESLVPSVLAEEKSVGNVCHAKLQPVEFLQTNEVVKWTLFEEVADKGDGEIYYELSFDGKTWLSFDGEARWSDVVGSGMGSTAKEVQAGLEYLPVGKEQIIFRSIIETDCESELKLLSLDIKFDSELEQKEHRVSGNTADDVRVENSEGDEVVATDDSLHLTVDDKEVAELILEEDLNLNNSEVGAEDDKVWLHLEDEAKAAIQKLIIKVPRNDDQDELLVCPNAQSADDIFAQCEDGFRLSEENPVNGIYRLVEVTATEWIIEVEEVEKFSTGFVGVNSDPILHWTFDSSDGCNVPDSSGNGYDGAVGTDCAGTPLVITPGLVSNAASFDGTGQEVLNSGIVPSLNGLTEFTVSTWVKSNETNSDQGIFLGSQPAGSDDLIGFRYDKVGANSGCVECIKAGITLSGGGNLQLETGDNVQSLDWQMLTLTWRSGDILRFYIDGSEIVPAQVSSAVGSVTLDAVQDLVVGQGAKDTGANGWNGLIDEFVIFDYQLTDTEIENLLVNFQSLELLTPVDGDYLQIGDNTNITWNSVNYAEDVNLYYSNDGFVSQDVIVEDLANVGSYNWTIPNDSGSGVEVKLVASGNDLINDTLGTYEIANWPQALGYWPLDENIGGTTVNIVTNDTDTVVDATWTTGVSGSALSFDGSGDYVAVNQNFTLAGELPELTNCAWFKVPPGGGGWSFLDFDRSDYFNFEIGYTGRVDGFLRFNSRSNPGSTHDMTGTTNVRDDEWHFACAVYDGVDKIIYLDGVEEARVVNAHGGSPIGRGTTRYGFIGDGSEATSFDGSRNNAYFLGLIDEIRLWDQSLDLATINEVYSSVSLLNMTAGTGGESLQVGTNFEIEWDTLNGSGNVDISYSTDDFVTETVIQSNLVDTGAYTWLVPNDPGLIKLRVKDSALVLMDTSDADLEIIDVQLTPLFEWPLDENAGLTTENVITNDIDDLQGANWTTGVKGSGLVFDGTNWVSLNANFALIGALPEMSVCGWFKVDAGEGGWSILDFDRSEYFNLEIGRSNKTQNTIGFSTADTTGQIHDLYGTTNVRDGLWHQACAVYDGTDKHIYLDGALEVSNSNSHSGRDLGTGDTRYAFIGEGSEAASYNSTRNNAYFIGSVDEIAVWDEAMSASEISNYYGQILNDAPVVSDVVVSQLVTSGDVQIDYTLTDINSDFLNLFVYEYSETGAFAGEQKEMTLVSGSSPISGLTADTGGESHSIVWDARTDLTTYLGTVYVRLKATDGIELSDYGSGDLLVLDLTKPAVQINSSLQNGTLDFEINYDLIDDTVSNNQLYVEYSTDAGASYNAASTVSGIVGLGITSAAGNDLTWENLNVDLVNSELTDLMIRLTYQDVWGNDGEEILLNQIIDTRSPSFLSVLALTELGQDVLVEWELDQTETNFERYEVSLDTNIGGVRVDVSSFTNIDDLTLGLIATDEFTLISLSYDVPYVVSVNAFDAFGNEAGVIEQAFMIESPVVVDPGSGGGGGSGSGGIVLMDPPEVDSEPETDPVINEPSPEVDEVDETVEPVPVVDEESEVVEELPVIGQLPLVLDFEDIVVLEEGVGIEPIVEGAPPVFIDEGIQDLLEQTRESRLLPVPSVERVISEEAAGELVLQGTAVPNAEVLIFVNSAQAVVSRVKADNRGDWEYIHSQSIVELAPGDHTAYVMTIDPESKVRSLRSDNFGFVLQRNSLAYFFGKYTDFNSTLSVIVVVVLAMFALSLVGKYIRKKEKVS